MIASFYSAHVSRHFQHALSAAGIPSLNKRRKRKSYVSVDNKDREKARDLFEIHNDTHPDLLPPVVRRDFDCLILGVVIAASAWCVLLFIGLGTDGSLQLLITLAVRLVAIGASAGHLLDRCRVSRRVYGRVSATTLDYLLVLCALAGVLSFFAF